MISSFNIIFIVLWVLIVVEVNGFYKVPINCRPSRISQIAYKLNTPMVKNLYKSKVQLREKLSLNYENYPNIDKSNLKLGVISPIVALIVQNSLLIVLMRYTMISTSSKPASSYIVSTAVFISEFLKFLISFVILFIYESKRNLYNFTQRVWNKEKKNKFLDLLIVSIPAFLYIIQNNLQYLAVANLSPAVFQVLYQMKIITAAIFSKVLLNRKLTISQWSAILFLMIGLVITQISQSIPELTGIEEIFSQPCSRIGFIAVLCASITSGLAGVLIEKVIKNQSQVSPTAVTEPNSINQSSIWYRNFQMAGLGSLISLVSCFLKDGKKISEFGFLSGYNIFVIGVIVLQAVGGLIVAQVVSKTDNLVKGFATSLSIILSCILSQSFFKDIVMSNRFILGAILVIASTALYSWPGNNNKNKKN